MSDSHALLCAEIERLRRQVERLRAALVPFAEAVDDQPNPYVAIYVQRSDCLRAGEALAAEGYM